MTPNTTTTVRPTERATIIGVEYRLIEDYHTFTSGEVGLYVSDKNPEKAFESVGPSLEKLIKLNAGVNCTVEPAMSLAEFLRASRNSDEDSVPHPSVIASRSYVMRLAA